MSYIGGRTTPWPIGGQIYSASPPLSSYLVTRSNQRVEALIWLFAYTLRHVNNYFELLDHLRIDNRELESSEDVPLSFAGDDYPLIHKVGTTHHCPSDDKDGIATWKSPGFKDHRDLLILQMREFRRFNRAHLEGKHVETG